MYVDVGSTAEGTFTNWVAESGVLDLFFLLGPKPAQVGHQKKFAGAARATCRGPDSNLPLGRFRSSTLSSQGPPLCHSTSHWVTTSAGGIIGMRPMFGRWTPTLTPMTSPTTLFGWT